MSPRRTTWRTPSRRARRGREARPATARGRGRRPESAREAGRSGSRVRQLEREGEVAADFLETLLDIADLDGDLDVDVDGDRAAVAIVDSEEGRVPRRLVGQDGKVLEALQELTRLAVQVETGERSRLMLDVAGPPRRASRALVELARVAIDEVKASGEKKPLEPMSAFERKVVHDEVAAAGLDVGVRGRRPEAPRRHPSRLIALDRAVFHVKRRGRTRRLVRACRRVPAGRS